MELQYVGPHDAVEVSLPAGPTVLVEHEGKADFPKQVAKSLLEQGPQHWKPAKQAEKKEA